MTDPTRDQVIDIIDQLAREWDACEYDGPGETIDIGDAIRMAGFRRVHALFDASGVAASPASSCKQDGGCTDSAWCGRAGVCLNVPRPSGVMEGRDAPR